MDSPSKSELTTTLRLGGNEPVADSASSLLSELLDSVSESEKETVDQILRRLDPGSIPGSHRREEGDNS